MRHIYINSAVIVRNHVTVYPHLSAELVSLLFDEYMNNEYLDFTCRKVEYVNNCKWVHKMFTVICYVSTT